MKLLVLDGNSIVNRAFYGIRLLTTKDGVPTNAIYGFINILLMLKSKAQPDGVVACFDLRAPTFRHKMYDGYKAGRKSMPEELAAQMPLLKELLPYMGVTVLQQEGYEADDLLGTLAAECKAGGHECVLATGDRDSLQLVNDHTHVLLATSKAGKTAIVEYTPDLIREEKGIDPIQLIDVKALMGDPSDKIPGVSGVGEKTALSLIGRFGSLDGVYASLDSPDIRQTLRQKLAAEEDMARLSYTLGKIKCDVPLTVTPSELFGAPEDPAALAAMLTRLELFKFLERMGLKDLPVAPPTRTVSDTPVTFVQESPLPELSPEETVYLYVNTHAAVTVGQTVYLYRDPKTVLPLLRGHPVATHNLKDLYRAGFAIENPAFDAALAAYLLDPSDPEYSLERLLAFYQIPVTDVMPPEDFGEFALQAAALPELCRVLKEKLTETDSLDLLYNVEIPLSRVLADMEADGFLVDWEELAAYGETLGKTVAGLEREIYDLVGYEFNLNSPKQLGEALFVKLGLPAKKKTKNGFSTSAEVLEELHYAHPCVEKLLLYRQASKLKSTYVDGFLPMRGADDRVHTTFHQTETRTGRISSSEPNLQNIPVRRENGRELRRFFSARPGYVLCDADYSQIELRVLAHMANDPAMIEIFAHGGDIHASTAARVFHVPPELVTPLMRSRAKAVNFGIVYGIGAYSLSKDLNIPFGEAKAYIENYMNTFAGVAAYMEKTVETARQTGYVATLLGRRRYLPELKASNAVTRSFGERVARNMPVQGTSADIIKIAMIRVHDALNARGLHARLILQIHDELIVETPEAEQEEVLALLKQEMEQAVSLSVPMEVDAHVGKTWYDAKG